MLWLHGQVKTPPFSAVARIEAGMLLRRLQEGGNISLPHSRPMPSIGRGCPLGIPDENRTWRVEYYVDALAVVILEVFAKTTSQTPQTVIDVCKSRLKCYKSLA
ncbi:type II toxin-antitoxin system RelE/ParE family toxin [Georgfuchsia toluolica]|uniref:type II toxin-antitoxin system RelE/ParE family toxin n=1 Tax=Georgfuchsia toluolica TaxID=424218 RepID=UPI003CCEAB55